ncbi:NADPH:quinone reductase-like Zn-dependent oxidoreductase [Kitasatospora gansuensis]|uniref:NADPH:quinone reductase-like Zn-dependent oxidoreductase n=1 Tax=Kitasatospora gansuensis TaxID=258050 RepID=A0A7W7S6F2_9ACTN|nr:zinc-binding dehydrogenase [Kitasatospora gansuensis]MBB4944764.1 NADPH:quinone reductase-like Zn-dependent oxidoreductase [Kitasatospora gansuensis]
MRRVRYHRHGGPEVLCIEEAEAPEPGPGDLLIRTRAIGVTLPNVRKVRGGSDLPGLLGGELAGEVVGFGPEVTGFRVGDRVTAISFTGSYAELATAPAVLAERIPDGVSDVQALALVRSGHVALAALATARPTAGESVLITGAASGVGHLAVQLARLRGIGRVVAAVGSPEKADFVRSLGAHEVVTYDSESWGEPVDVVLEGVGGEVLPRALAALAPGGRMVFFGSGGGTVPAFDLLAGAKTVTGLTMARFASTQRERYDRHGEELWELALAGRLRPAVHAEIPLAEAAEAHRIIEARANLGKVVLRP